MSEISGKPVYGICGCKEKRQVLSVEQVVELIQQMAENDWQVPADYIPKTSVNGIIEQNGKDEIRLWVGTQAEYDALTAEEKGHSFAIITDDPTKTELDKILEQHGQSIENLGATLSPVADTVNKLSAGTSATFGDYLVPRMRQLWSGTLDLDGLTTDGSDVLTHTITLDETAEGKRLYIEVAEKNRDNLSGHIVQFLYDGTEQLYSNFPPYMGGSPVAYFGVLNISCSGNQLTFKEKLYPYADPTGSDFMEGNTSIRAIYEVIL